MAQPAPCAQVLKTGVCDCGLQSENKGQAGRTLPFHLVRNLLNAGHVSSSCLGTILIR